MNTQFNEIMWLQHLTKKWPRNTGWLNREQPNEMQLDVYVRARMRIPVAMETVMCVSHSAQWESKWRLPIYYQRWCIDWLSDGGCQTNLRKRCPSTVTSHRSHGILRGSRQRFFLVFFHEWENQEQEYVQQTDMSETAVWVEMKGLVILKAVSAA